MSIQSHKTKSALVAALLFIVSLSYYVHLALDFPELFNVDNQENLSATSYIAEHHRLPVVEADSEELVFTSLGTTRSLRPPFTYIVSAFVSELTEPFIANTAKRYRLGSSLIAALTLVVIFVGLNLAFQHIGLALLGAVLLGLLPRYVFLATCNNDDVGAIFSSSVLFTGLLAVRACGVKTWILAYLAAAFGLVMQTKFTAWLWLPWVGLYCIVALKDHWGRLLKIGPALMLITVVAGGWWLIWNMWFYGFDDPTALKHAAQIQMELNGAEASHQGYRSIGVNGIDLLANHDGFVSKTYASFVGYLAWIQLDVGAANYVFYGLLFLVGVLVSLISTARVQFVGERWLCVLILILLINQIGFYFHHNLARDVQAEGRYLLPLAFPLLYLFLQGLRVIPLRSISLTIAQKTYDAHSLLAFIILGACMGLHLETLRDIIKPSYQPRALNMQFGEGQPFTVEQLLPEGSTGSISVWHKEEGVQLRRTAKGLAAVDFAADFCRKLPVNALVVLTVGSKSPGALVLEIERDQALARKKRVWQPYEAGQSELLFAVNGKSCVKLRLVLGRRTHLVDILGLRLNELAVSRYSLPIP